MTALYELSVSLCPRDCVNFCSPVPGYDAIKLFPDAGFVAVCIAPLGDALVFAVKCVDHRCVNSNLDLLVGTSGENFVDTRIHFFRNQPRQVITGKNLIGSLRDYGRFEFFLVNVPAFPSPIDLKPLP